MTHCPDVTLRCRHDNSLNGLCRTKRKCSCGHVAKGPYDCVRRRWSVAVGLSARSPISRATVLRLVDGGIALDGVPSRSRWTVNDVAAAPVTRPASSHWSSGTT